MINFRHLFSAALVLGSLCLSPGNARAETFQTCAGFINSLPATISTQGVWCMNKDLATSMASGNAINITANNVTIDCNGFKIGGLAAGNTSVTIGIFADGRQNATVRNCNVRGFYNGIALISGAGHLVEDNRLDNNLQIGVVVVGDNSRVQRNRIYDTGGALGANSSIGILAFADVIDSTVAGVFATDTDTFPTGILVSGTGSEARGNQVRGLVVAGTGEATGIVSGGDGVRITANHVAAAAMTSGDGIIGQGVGTFCTGNSVANFATAYNNCEYNVDNLPAP